MLATSHQKSNEPVNTVFVLETAVTLVVTFLKEEETKDAND